MTDTLEDRGLAYRLQDAGPPLFARPSLPCGFCGESRGAHPEPGRLAWTSCPVRYIVAAELSPDRRRLRGALS